MAIISAIVPMTAGGEGVCGDGFNNIFSSMSVGLRALRHRYALSTRAVRSHMLFRHVVQQFRDGTAGDWANSFGSMGESGCDQLSGGVPVRSKCKVRDVTGHRRRRRVVGEWRLSHLEM